MARVLHCFWFFITLLVSNRYVLGTMDKNLNAVNIGVGLINIMEPEKFRTVADIIQVSSKNITEERVYEGKIIVNTDHNTTEQCSMKVSTSSKPTVAKLLKWKCVKRKGARFFSMNWAGGCQNCVNLYSVNGNRHPDVVGTVKNMKTKKHPSLNHYQYKWNPATKQIGLDPVKIAKTNNQNGVHVLNNMEKGRNPLLGSVNNFKGQPAAQNSHKRYKASGDKQKRADASNNYDNINDPSKNNHTEVDLSLVNKLIEATKINKTPVSSPAMNKIVEKNKKDLTLIGLSLLNKIGKKNNEAPSDKPIKSDQTRTLLWLLSKLNKPGQNDAAGINLQLLNQLIQMSKKNAVLSHKNPVNNKKKYPENSYQITNKTNEFNNNNNDTVTNRTSSVDKFNESNHTRIFLSNPSGMNKFNKNTNPTIGLPFINKILGVNKPSNNVPSHTYPASKYNNTHIGPNLSLVNKIIGSDKNNHKTMNWPYKSRSDEFNPNNHTIINSSHTNTSDKSNKKDHIVEKFPSKNNIDKPKKTNHTVISTSHKIKGDLLNRTSSLHTDKKDKYDKLNDIIVNLPLINKIKKNKKNNHTYNNVDKSKKTNQTVISALNKIKGDLLNRTSSLHTDKKDKYDKLNDIIVNLPFINKLKKNKKSNRTNKSKSKDKNKYKVKSSTDTKKINKLSKNHHGSVSTPHKGRADEANHHTETNSSNMEEEHKKNNHSVTAVSSSSTDGNVDNHTVSKIPHQSAVMLPVISNHTEIIPLHTNSTDKLSENNQTVISELRAHYI